MNDYNTKALKVIEQIYVHDYYVSRFTTIMAGRDVMQLNNYQLRNLLHDFWDSLPDSPAIHRHPFNELCDLLDVEH